MASANLVSSSFFFWKNYIGKRTFSKTTLCDRLKNKPNSLVNQIKVKLYFFYFPIEYFVFKMSLVKQFHHKMLIKPINK